MSGTLITAYRCNNVSCSRASLAPLGSVAISDPTGRFSLLLDNRDVGGARLLFEALVDDSSTFLGDTFTGAGQRSSITYRTMDFGSLSNAPRFEDIRLKPASEAAIQLLEETGIESYSKDGIRSVITAVDAATRDETFAGDSAIGAVDRALELARMQQEVEDAVGDAHPFCIGDCNEDRRIQVDEIVMLVGIAVEQGSFPRCTEGNASTEAMITVDELVSVIGNALSGCPE